MLEVSASAVVPAPAGPVFALLCDTARYPEWVAGTDEVTRTDGPAHTPPRRLVHVTTDIPLSSRFEVAMEVASEGEEASEVVLTLRGQPSLGPVGAVFARPMQGQVDRDNRKSVEAFAELATRELAAPQTPRA